MKSFMSEKLLTALILCLIIASPAFAEDMSAVVKDAKAYGLYSKEKYDSAINAYRSAIGANPKFAPLYDGIGNVYLKKNQYDKAFSNFKTASSLDSKNSLYKIHAQEAVFLNTINKINEAKMTIGKAANLLPDNSKIVKNINKIRDGKYQDLEFITDMYLNYRDKNLSKGNQAFNEKRYSEAENFYFKSINARPRNYQAYNNLGLVYLAQNKIPNAMSCFKKSIEQYANAAYPYNNMGVAYLRLKKHKDALGFFDKASSVNKAYSSGFNNKAVAMINDSLKNTQVSIKYLETIARSESANMPAKQLLGQFYSLVGDWKKAIDIYKSGLDMASDNSRYIRRLGDLFYLDSRLTESIACYKKSISLNSEEPASFVAIARAYEKNNDFKNAFSNYQTAIRLNPNYPNTYRYFGYFLVDQKRENEAKGILRKYVDLLPNSYDTPVVKSTLRKIYSNEEIK